MLLSAIEEDIGEARLTNEEMADPGVGGPSVDVRFSVVSVVVDVVVVDVDVDARSLLVMSAGSPDDCAGHGVSACRYSHPRHQMGCSLSSFFGSGSQKNWMIFLYWLPRSTLFIFSRRGVSISYPAGSIVSPLKLTVFLYNLSLWRYRSCRRAGLL